MADKYGRKPVLCLCIAGVTAASAFYCGVCESEPPWPRLTPFADAHVGTRLVARYIPGPPDLAVVSLLLHRRRRSRPELNLGHDIVRPDD